MPTRRETTLAGRWARVKMARARWKAHDAQMNANVKRFEDEISQRTLDTLANVKLHNDYEDYILKSRQANHVHWQVYGPLATAGFSAAIAAILALYTISSYFWPPVSTPSQADIVLKIIGDSGTHIESNLNAFRKAGLITLNRDAIKKLSAQWQPKGNVGH